MSQRRHAGKFDELDRILSDWRSAPDLTPEPTVRRIIHLFQKPAIAWIGYGAKEEFPGNGFFVDEAFEFTEVP